jgi:tRNA-modifying protein YgfZ
MSGHPVSGVPGRGGSGVQVLVAPERVVETLMRHYLVERRKRRAGGQRSAKQPPPAQPQRPVLFGLSIFHNQDFGTSKRHLRRPPRIEAVTTVELDGQYRALREEAGVLERPERRLLVARGPDAVEFVHDQVTNDITSLAPGGGCYAALLNRKGQMQADLRVLRTAPDELLLDCEQSGRDALGAHLGLYRVGREVEFENLAESHTVLSVIGPATTALTGIGPLGPEHAHREVTLWGVEARAVATDLGLDLICRREDVPALSKGLTEAGVEQVDDAAAEIARVESGRPRFGREMTTETIPQEAGINERAVDFGKGCYIGQETVARLHYRGKPNRHLRGLRLAEPVPDGSPIRLGERELGTVGTAVLSPAHGPIALAIVRREAEPGATVEILSDGDIVQAAVVELPFV